MGRTERGGRVFIKLCWLWGGSHTSDLELKSRSEGECHRMFLLPALLMTASLAPSSLLFSSGLLRGPPSPSCSPPFKSELAFLFHELDNRSFQGEFGEMYVKFTNGMGLRVWLIHLSPSLPLPFLSLLPSFTIVLLSLLPLVFTFTVGLLN